MDQCARLLVAALGFAGLHRPSYDRPLWALRSDLQMFALWLTGRLRPELEKAGVEPGVPVTPQRLKARKETL